MAVKKEKLTLSDISKLTNEELLELYNKIDNFLLYLESEILTIEVEEKDE